MTPADLTFVASIASHIVTLLVRPTTEDRPDPIKVERLEQEGGGYLWAVRCRGNVLSRSGRWAWEPSPSSRRKDHARRYRFESLEAAWKAAIKAQAVADREWAEHCARIDAKRAGAFRHLGHTPHTQRILAPGALEASADALAALLAWVQPDDGLEAGGVLLGRYITGGGMVIDAISTPGPRDIRERCYFHRDGDHHNGAILAAWEASGGTCHYLGNWHTHPEPIPAPSPLDVSEWLRDAAEIRAQHQSPNLPLVYLIIGQHRIGAWAIGDPASPKFEGFER